MVSLIYRDRDCIEMCQEADGTLMELLAVRLQLGHHGLQSISPGAKSGLEQTDPINHYLSTDPITNYLLQTP